VEASARGAQRIDALIGGAGFAGLALAIALRQGLGPSFSVTVADPALTGAAKDGRASAIVAAARRLFETIGVWQKVEAQPILDMVVTDSRLSDVVRPVFLTFEGDVGPGEPFAHMIENAALLAGLVEKAKDEGVTLRTAAVADFAFTNDRVSVRLSDGDTLAARLLIAADGARSAIRERAGIASHGFSYGQSAIVATVAHERDHRGRAEEHFLPAGPFAILPLKRDPSVGHRSSIVWTEQAHEAARIVALPDAEFHAELERRFGLHLGEIRVVGPRRVHPLGLSVARTFIADRLALVGDAAHVIHPIAGQGLNMGLKDVAALAEVSVGSTPSRWGLRPMGSTGCSRINRTCCASCATWGSVSSIVCPH
jgi:2-octaprenyl-6-methoxyphenol hydroxylase